MTDEEFVNELTTRLNLFLEVGDERAQATLTTPLMHVGYASVGHFLGQLCCPRGISDTTPPEQLQNVKFLMPVVDDGRITSFQAVTGAELQRRVGEMAKKAAQDTTEPSDGDKVH